MSAGNVNTTAHGWLRDRDGIVIAGGWPYSLLELDLNFWSDAIACGARPRPSQRELAATWCRSKSDVARIVKAYDEGHRAAALIHRVRELEAKTRGQSKAVRDERGTLDHGDMPTISQTRGTPSGDGHEISADGHETGAGQTRGKRGANAGHPTPVIRPLSPQRGANAGQARGKRGTAPLDTRARSSLVSRLSSLSPTSKSPSPPGTGTSRSLREAKAAEREAKIAWAAERGLRWLNEAPDPEDLARRYRAGEGGTVDEFAENCRPQPVKTAVFGEVRTVFQRLWPDAPEGIRKREIQPGLKLAALAHACRGLLTELQPSQPIFAAIARGDPEVVADLEAQLRARRLLERGDATRLPEALVLATALGSVPPRADGPQPVLLEAREPPPLDPGAVLRWDEAMPRLVERIGRSDVEIWLSEVRPVRLDEARRRLGLHCPDQHYLAWIAENYLPALEECTGLEVELESFEEAGGVMA